MIRTVLTLRVEPSKLAAVLAMYRDEDILQFSLDHSQALASEISVAADGSGEVIVTALWPDEAAYRGWLDHPSRQESAPRLARLLEGAAEVGPGRVFVVDHAVSKMPSAPIVSQP